MKLFGGFWKRLGAGFIDASILIFIFAVLIAVTDQDYKTFVALLLLAFVWLYFALFESGSQQGTPGKMTLSLKVTSQHGHRISFARATARYFMKILVSPICFFVGFWMIAFTEGKRGLHDMIASTLVLNADAMTETRYQELQASAARGMSGWAVVLIVVFVLIIPITGILAAIAIPSYQDYLVRARVSEAYSAGMSAARLVGDFYEREQDVPADLEQLQFASPPLVDVTMDPSNGIVTAVYRGGTPKLRFIPSLQDNRVVWRCDPGGLRRNQTGNLCSEQRSP